MSQQYQSWTDLLITLQWPFFGAVARTFQDNRQLNKSGWALMRLHTVNAMIAFSCAQIVFPISAELGLSKNWQAALLYIAGYWGLGFLDVVQAKIRWHMNRFGGQYKDEPDNH